MTTPHVEMANTLRRLEEIEARKKVIRDAYNEYRKIDAEAAELVKYIPGIVRRAKVDVYGGGWEIALGLFIRHVVTEMNLPVEERALNTLALDTLPSPVAPS